MPYFVCARDGAGRIILKRDTRETAEKKAAELRDMGEECGKGGVRNRQTVGRLGRA
ncbi:hypothetical protein [Bradyrhizobium liaoningense]